MADGIYTALSGAIAQQQALDVAANNVANATTKGYRGDRVAFNEILSEMPMAQGVPRTARYVEASTAQYDRTEGAMMRTGNPLDVALMGDGYLAVQTKEGVRYTRNGSLMMDDDGVLRTQHGHEVLDESGKRIAIPAKSTDVQISERGQVRANGIDVGTLALRKFEKPELLTKQGNTLFALTDPNAKPMQAEDIKVVQDHLESSNVNAVLGLNELININRSFDALQRAIETFNKLDERAARDLGARNG
jgi:flagellar basal-body rod protein FlgF